MVRATPTLGLPDRSRRLDVDDDRDLQVDQIVVGVGKEGMSFVSAGPLRGWVRLVNEFRYCVARRAPGRFIQRIEILPDGSARPCNGPPVNLISSSNSALLVSVGGNQAGIDRKGGA